MSCIVDETNMMEDKSNSAETSKKEPTEGDTKTMDQAELSANPFSNSDPGSGNESKDLPAKPDVLDGQPTLLTVETGPSQEPISPLSSPGTTEKFVTPLSTTKDTSSIISVTSDVTESVKISKREPHEDEVLPFVTPIEETPDPTIVSIPAIEEKSGPNVSGSKWLKKEEPNPLDLEDI
jgi:hypothetical protein